VLPGWPDDAVDLRRRWGGQRSLVLIAHPGTTPQHGGLELLLFRLQVWHEQQPAFAALGYDVAFLSAQPLEEQERWLRWARFRIVILSDVELQLAASLLLPTLRRGEGSVYKDCIVVSHGGEVAEAFSASQAVREDVEAVLRFVRSVHE
jgi:peroxiredoxin